ncbi:MAG: hypothetical protein KAR87_03915 [Candidatus Aenigmarchaeota archaeon]|nr:hypothetical protein [Candidatus Aenigmarchaeota archaeon]
MEQLDEMENEMAKEIGNIGSGRIGMAISQNTGAEIVIDVTRTYIFTEEKFSSLFDYLDKNRYSLDFKMKESKGGLLVMFPRDTDNMVVVKMRSKDKKSLTAMSTSYAVSCKDYLSIEDSFEFSKQYSKLGVDILKDVFISEGEKEVAKEGKVFLIDTRFCWKGKDDKTGHIFLYFCNDGADMVLQKITDKVKEMM